MQERVEDVYDKGEQTAVNHTLLINNPPHDATSPEEWRNYFLASFQGAHVTCCTVVMDNDLLMRCLIKRREVMTKIRARLPPDIPQTYNELARVAAEVEFGRGLFRRMFMRLASCVGLEEMPELFGRLVVLNGKIIGLAQQKYRSTKVFVTFETEKTKNEVLERLEVGFWKRWRRDSSSVEKYLFRNEVILNVGICEDPSAIRWNELNTDFGERWRTLCFSYTFSFAITVACLWFIYHVHESPKLGAYTISAFNVIFPILAEKLTDFELHPQESIKETSLFAKLVIFRTLNTVITSYFYKVGWFIWFF